MHTTQHDFDVFSWAYKNFGKVPLFDKRRTKRLVSIASRICKHPGQSFASSNPKWYDTKAIYNLFKLNVMTPDNIQSSHRALIPTYSTTWVKVRYFLSIFSPSVAPRS